MFLFCSRLLPAGCCWEEEPEGNEADFDGDILMVDVMRWRFDSSIRLIHSIHFVLLLLEFAKDGKVRGMVAAMVAMARHP